MLCEADQSPQNAEYLRSIYVGSAFTQAPQPAPSQAPAFLPIEPLHIASVRGLPLWDGCDVPMGSGVEGELDWDKAALQESYFEADQRISW